MSKILFVPLPTDTDAFLTSASHSLLSHSALQSHQYNYDFLSDTPLSVQSGFAWEERDTDDEGEEEEGFAAEARDWLQAALDGKKAYYGFDFEAETPIQAGQFVWETVEKKPELPLEERLSLSTMATSD